MPNHSSTQSRRRFVHTFGILTAGAFLPGSAFSAATENLTIQQVIDIILKDIPGAPFAKTVDTIKAGDAGQMVTGIVTTMFATIEVIEKARKLGANFIIAHEPSYYNHADETKCVNAAEDAKYNQQQRQAAAAADQVRLDEIVDAAHCHR